MDEDLAGLSRDQLIEEVRKLRQGIRGHRDSTGQELCWHHPALWGLLPEQQDPLPTVPDWPQFLRGCIRYRQSLDDQLPHAPRSPREYDRQVRWIIADPPIRRIFGEYIEHVVKVGEWKSGWSLGPGKFRVRSWYNGREGKSAPFTLTP